MLTRVFSKCFQQVFCEAYSFFSNGKVRCAALGLLPGAMLGAGSWREQQRCLPLPLLPPPSPHPHWGHQVSQAEQGEGKREREREKEEKEPSPQPNPGGAAHGRGASGAGFRGAACLVRGLWAKENSAKSDCKEMVLRKNREIAACFSEIFFLLFFAPFCLFLFRCESRCTTQMRISSCNSEMAEAGLSFLEPHYFFGGLIQSPLN